MNVILLFGAILGLSSIMMAAYVDHSLALHLSGKSLSEILTAIRYHQLYAIVICVIGLSSSMQISNRLKSWLIRSAYVFLIGVLLFSFSIYLSVIFSVDNFTNLIPLGGILLMAGWGCLIRAALLKMK